MGTFRRSAKDWSSGWMPSSDLVNGPESGILRADNVHLDDLGILSLRLGCVQNLPGYTGALSGGETNVDSLYTAPLNSSPTTLSVFRTVGASGASAGTGAIYINGARRDSGIAGSGDIAIHHGFGQIFWARSTRKRKNDGKGTGGEDGRGTRNWGIAAPSQRPTFSVSPPDGATFTTCDASESPPFEADEGTLSFIDGNDETPDSAIQMTPDAESGRATATQIFGGPQDFTAYDGGDAGIPEDIIEAYIRCSNPERMTSITLMFDCNPDSAAPFQDDYYSYDLLPDVLVKIKPEDLISAQQADNAETRLDQARTRYNLKFGLDGQTGEDLGAFKIRPDADWARFAIPRKSFTRNGGSEDCDWSTVTAVRVVGQSDATLGTALTNWTLDVDNITISGGAAHPFTGTYTARYRWRKSFGNYVAYSPLSPASNPVICKANGLRVNIPAAALASRDDQADQVEVFLSGGALDFYYRFAVADITGSDMSVDVNIREADAVSSNIVADLNDTTPPDNVISIAGPAFGRLLVLAPDGVHLSRFNNPDTFSLNEVIKIGDGGEVPQWMVYADGRILVGTTANIHQISGTLVALPDGTIDARVDALNVPGATDRCVAVDGPVVAYIGPDGPRLLAGGGSKLIVGGLDLLFRDPPRYGVGGINLGLAPGRSRVAIHSGFAYYMMPESGFEDGSPYIYRYDLGADRWWRRIYPFNIRSIYRDPANLLYAGTDDGRVFSLESGQDDLGEAIPYTVYTISEGLGQPLQKKDFHDLIVNADTGGSTATFAFHADQSTTATLTASVVGTESAPIHQEDASALSGAKRIQLRISGESTGGFKLYDYALNFRERPMPRVRWDTGYTPLANTLGNELVWFRRLTLTANTPVDLKAQVYFSGTLQGTYTITATNPNVTEVYWIPIDRACKGRQPLIVITPLDPGEEETAFECYKLGFQLRNTGTRSEWKFAEWQPEL